jgi:hypothetical protein
MERSLRFTIALLLLIQIGRVYSENNFPESGLLVESSTTSVDSVSITSYTHDTKADKKHNSIVQKSNKYILKLIEFWKEHKVGIIQSVVGGFLVILILSFKTKILLLLFNASNRLKNIYAENKERRLQKISFSIKELQKNEYSYRVFHQLLNQTNDWVAINDINIGNSSLRDKSLSYLKINSLIRIKKNKVKLTNFGRKIAYEKNRNI